MSQDQSQKAWFEEWFDTPFYHSLYQSRDEREAMAFIDRILEHFPLKTSSRILDLACGKGRHSKHLHTRGYEVLGVDLSENSITSAQKWTSQTLNFKVGDMREPQGHLEFDAVFNLFTSFGYFETPEDNIRTLESIHLSLKPNGLLIIDFMNAHKAVQHLQPHYELQRGGIDFAISKSIENQIISKKIDFIHQGIPYHFEERVQLLDLPDFQKYFEKTQFTIINIFGDYQLHGYEPEVSDRLILVARKL